MLKLHLIDSLSICYTIKFATDTNQIEPMKFRPKPGHARCVASSAPCCDIQQSVERNIVDSSSPSGEENMFLTSQLCIQKLVT